MAGVPGVGKFGIRTLSGIWWNGRGFTSSNASTAQLYKTFADAEADYIRAYSSRPAYMLEIVQVRLIE
jgi:hypothetical protein